MNLTVGNYSEGEQEYLSENSFKQPDSIESERPMSKRDQAKRKTAEERVQRDLETEIDETNTEIYDSTTDLHDSVIASGGMVGAVEHLGREIEHKTRSNETLFTLKRAAKQVQSKIEAAGSINPKVRKKRGNIIVFRDKKGLFVNSYGYDTEIEVEGENKVVIKGREGHNLHLSTNLQKESEVERVVEIVNLINNLKRNSKNGNLEHKKDGVYGESFANKIPFNKVKFISNENLKQMGVNPLDLVRYMKEWGYQLQEYGQKSKSEKIERKRSREEKPDYISSVGV